MPQRFLLLPQGLVLSQLLTLGGINGHLHTQTSLLTLAPPHPLHPPPLQVPAEP